ncbi:MAG: hypothetical protein IGS03_16930 [Candidatus Sericytochromatia bacterium]|nr:hypothetical protein [Candidatus Sericytochromatia bacterium]
MKPMKKKQQAIITGLEGLQHTLPAPLVEMVCKLLDSLDFDDKGQLRKSKFIHDICFDTYHLTMRFWVATLAGHVLCGLPAESEAQHQYQREIYETLQNCALGNWVQDLLKQVEASKDWLASDFEPLYQALTRRHRLPTGITAFVDAAQKFLPHNGPSSKSWSVFLCEWMPFYRNKMIGHGACRYQESDYQLLTLAFLKAIVTLLKWVQQHWPQELVLLRQTENQPRSGGTTPARHSMQCQVWKTGDRQPKRQSGQSETALYANRLYLAKATDATPGENKEQAKKWVWKPLVDYGALMVIQAQGAHSAFYFLNALPERQAEQEYLEMSQGFFWLAPLLEKRLQQAFRQPVLRLQPRPPKPDPLRERLQVQHWIHFALQDEAQGLRLELKELLQRSEALTVLEGPGGAGKSGALSEAYKHALTDWKAGQGPCPVFIRLGIYRESKDLTQLIRDALSCQAWTLSHPQPLLLFCDGLNEVMPGLRIRVVEDIRYLLEHNPKHRLIVSGRNEDGELEQLLDEAPLALSLLPPETEWIQTFLKQEGEHALARWMHQESEALQQLRLSPFIALVLLELWRGQPFQPEQSFSNGVLIQGLLNQMLAREQKKQGYTADFVKQSREALAELACLMQNLGIIYVDDRIITKNTKLSPKIKNFARAAGILIQENQNTYRFYHQLILELLAAEHFLHLEDNWSEKIEPLIWKHRAALSHKQAKVLNSIGQHGAMASLESRIQSLSLLLDLPLRDEEAIPLLEGLGHWLYQQVEVHLNTWTDGFAGRKESEVLIHLQCIQKLIQQIQTCQYPSREQHLIPQVIVPWLKRLEPHWYQTSDPRLQKWYAYAGQKRLAFANPLHFQLLRAFPSPECLAAGLELVQKYPHEVLLGQEGNLITYQYRQGLIAFLLAQPGGLDHMINALCTGQPEWEAFLQEVPLALRSSYGLPDTALSNYYVFFEDIRESYDTITKISAHNPLLINQIAKRKYRVSLQPPSQNANLGLI